MLRQHWHPKPFPHAVIDGLWSDSLLSRCSAEFPLPGAPGWITYGDPKEYGKAAGPEPMWGPAVHEWFEKALSRETCHALEEMTGIAPLVGDTLGGGMHQTHEGGRLDSHIDFGIHPVTGMERRINLLTFLNPGWDADLSGGGVVLGDPKVDGHVFVHPIFNRTVVFETSNDSWHGHPDPVRGPNLRKSLAVYYYAPARPETAERAGTTIWLEDTRG